MNSNLNDMNINDIDINNTNNRNSNNGIYDSLHEVFQKLKIYFS